MRDEPQRGGCQDREKKRGKTGVIGGHERLNSATYGNLTARRVAT
jgi:hypothetical protein